MTTNAAPQSLGSYLASVIWNQLPEYNAKNVITAVAFAVLGTAILGTAIYYPVTRGVVGTLMNVAFDAAKPGITTLISPSGSAILQQCLNLKVGVNSAIMTGAALFSILSGVKHQIPVQDTSLPDPTLDFAARHVVGQAMTRALPGPAFNAVPVATRYAQDYVPAVPAQNWSWAHTATRAVPIDRPTAQPHGNELQEGLTQAAQTYVAAVQQVQAIQQYNSDNNIEMQAALQDVGADAEPVVVQAVQAPSTTLATIVRIAAPVLFGVGVAAVALQAAPYVVPLARSAVSGAAELKKQTGDAVADMREALVDGGTSALTAWNQAPEVREAARKQDENEAAHFRVQAAKYEASVRKERREYDERRQRIARSAVEPRRRDDADITSDHFMDEELGKIRLKQFNTQPLPVQSVVPAPVAPAVAPKQEPMPSFRQRSESRRQAARAPAA